jgi:hypothetical protein
MTLARLLVAVLDVLAPSALAAANRVSGISHGGPTRTRSTSRQRTWIEMKNVDCAWPIRCRGIRRLRAR